MSSAVPIFRPECLAVSSYPWLLSSTPSPQHPVLLCLSCCYLCVSSSPTQVLPSVPSYRQRSAQSPKMSPGVSIWFPESLVSPAVSESPIYNRQCQMSPASNRLVSLRSSQLVVHTPTSAAYNACAPKCIDRSTWKLLLSSSISKLSEYSVCTV